MIIYKHKLFHLWAISEGLTDRKLKTAIDEISNGLYDASLGSGLYKKRVSASGRGKSGGYRTLVAFKSKDKAFFIYGFAKSNKGNINRKEERVYRQLAWEFLNMENAAIEFMIKNRKLFEVK